MKYWICVWCFILGCSVGQIKGQDFPCDDPPYYTLGEILYTIGPSPQMEFVHFLVGVFDELGLRRSGDPENVRSAGNDPFEDPPASNQRVGIRVEYIAGVRTVVLTPSVIRNNKKIVYYHGGGYSQEMILFQWDMVIDLARRAGSPVYIVEYGLVPDFTFPTPVNEGLAVYLELLQTFSPDELIFLGDSAGGGLALALAGKLRDDGLPLPARMILVSPWLDVEGDNPDMPAIDDFDRMLSVPGLQQGGLNYVNGNIADLDNPYASPLLLEGLGDLPPALLLIGTYDILYPDAVLFRDKAENQGMELEFVEVPGGMHVFPGAPAWFVPESARARRQMASYINCFDETGRMPPGQEEGFAAGTGTGFKIYPNPVAKSASLAVSVDQNASVAGNTAERLVILDPAGTVVYDAVLSGQQLYRWPVRELIGTGIGGLYHFVLYRNGKAERIPVFIED